MPIGELLKHRLVQLRVPRGTPHENLELFPNAFEGVARPQVPASYRNLLGGGQYSLSAPELLSRNDVVVSDGGRPPSLQLCPAVRVPRAFRAFYFLHTPAQKCAACLVRKPPALLRASA